MSCSHCWNCFCLNFWYKIVCHFPIMNREILFEGLKETKTSKKKAFPCKEVCLKKRQINPKRINAYFVHELIPGIVREVSATFVATTISLCPSSISPKTFAWEELGSIAYKDKTFTLPPFSSNFSPLVGFDFVSSWVSGDFLCESFCFSIILPESFPSGACRNTFLLY